MLRAEAPSHPLAGRTINVDRAEQGRVGRWFTEFWGPDFNPAVIDELAAPDIRFEYSLHAPCRGRDEVRAFAAKFRAAFPDLAFGGTADLIAEGDYVVGQWIGGGTQTGDAFDDMPVGELPAATGKSMRFTGTTVLKVVDGLITEEIGLDDGVTVLQQLGLIKPGLRTRARAAPVLPAGNRMIISGPRRSSASFAATRSARLHPAEPGRADQPSHPQRPGPARAPGWTRTEPPVPGPVPPADP